MSHEMDQRDLKDTDVTQLEDTQHLHGGVEKNHVVADNEAAEYVDPTLVLSPEESKRLRNKAFKRSVTRTPGEARDADDPVSCPS